MYLSPARLAAGLELLLHHTCQSGEFSLRSDFYNLRCLWANSLYHVSGLCWRSSQKSASCYASYDLLLEVAHQRQQAMGYILALAWATRTTALILHWIGEGPVLVVLLQVLPNMTELRSYPVTSRRVWMTDILLHIKASCVVQQFRCLPWSPQPVSWLLWKQPSALLSELSELWNTTKACLNLSLAHRYFADDGPSFPLLFIRSRLWRL